ncbi:hypothetical protein ACPPVU_12775 [Mucilaginibacter sp. McL0603]|uniref:hypothetical protein n=1 Tax=Mucilaginibacter sp. McL0603 TaxID=3415670 RepID=UPI003CFBB6C8
MKPAGAFLAARDIIADEINDHINLYSGRLAGAFSTLAKSLLQRAGTILFCRATGNKFDEDEAGEFADEIKKLRVTEALPIAKLFPPVILTY